MADASQDSEDTNHCRDCGKDKPVDAENWKANFGVSGLTLLTKCRACADCAKLQLREERASKAVSTEDGESDSDKENPVPKKASHSGGGLNSDASEFIGLLPLAPADFSEALLNADEVHSLCAIINTSDWEMDTAKVRADEMASLIWDGTGYRFSYVNSLITSRQLHIAAQLPHETYLQRQSRHRRLFALYLLLRANGETPTWPAEGFGQI
jgi:hypothetical protein